MKEKILNWILKFFIKDLKYWGVALETKLPPEFYITKHAEEKMLKRFGCNQEKIKKVTIKAWYSREPISEDFKFKKKLLGYKGSQYRMFNGNIFVFQFKYVTKGGFSPKRLVTVYNPKVNLI